MNRAQRRAQQRDAAKPATTPPPPEVAVIGLHNGNCRGSFTFCLTRMFVAETCRTGMPPGFIWQRFGSDQLVDARNDSVAFFLAEYPDTPWALFLDVDMGFPAETLAQLVADADPNERPVVGALAFALKKQGSEDEQTQAVDLRCCPTLYTYVEREHETGFLSITDYPRDAVVQVAATGMACVVVHRTILERICELDGPHWFDRIPRPKGKGTFGEDMSFCTRVYKAGGTVWVDTGLRTSHDKEGIFLTEEVWDRQQAHASVD